MIASGRRVCLFTGITGILGRDFAGRYADAYDLVGVYNTTMPEGPVVGLDSTDGLPPAGYYGVAVDLGGEGAIDDLVEAVLGRFGSIDLLVNAAVYRRFGPIKRRPFVESLDYQFYLNVCVPVEITSAIVRRAWQHTEQDNRRRRRSVVNLSSTAGHHVYPSRGQSGYGATKAALNAFTRHLSSELSELGVRANAIAPNTFPALVPTRTVSEAIRRYDQNERTGDILVIDTSGEYLLTD